MQVIKGKTSILEAIFLARIVLVATASMGNVNSFIQHRKLPAGKSIRLIKTLSENLHFLYIIKYGPGGNSPR